MGGFYYRKSGIVSSFVDHPHGSPELHRKQVSALQLVTVSVQKHRDRAVQNKKMHIGIGLVKRHLLPGQKGDLHHEQMVLIHHRPAPEDLPGVGGVMDEPDHAFTS
jgi:hypothetical protein